MDELRSVKIFNMEIECLEGKKEEIQGKIFDLFEYNRYPKDEEFLGMGQPIRELNIIEAKIIVLRKLLDATTYNREVF